MIAHQQSNVTSLRLLPVLLELRTALHDKLLAYSNTTFP
jgi:hypothetical protein